MNIEIDDDLYQRLEQAAALHKIEPKEYLKKYLNKSLRNTPTGHTGRKFHSFSKWLDAIDSLPAGRYYFRGEPSFYSTLEPKLQRYFDNLKVPHGCVEITHPSDPKPKKPSFDMYFKLQLSILGRMLRYTAQYHYDSTVVGKITNFWEWLCIAQHHGYPTMLLDWTLNPYVSMFFATDDPSGNFDDHDGRIWVMRLKDKDARSENTIHVGEENIHDSIIPRAIDDLDDNTKKILGKWGIDATTTYNRIYSETPLLVVPRILTRRIDAQSGRFIYWPSPQGQDIASLSAISTTGLPWESLFYYTVTPAEKQEIRRRLSNSRIHSGTMYADLDGYARYISNGGL